MAVGEWQSLENDPTPTTRESGAANNQLRGTCVFQRCIFAPTQGHDIPLRQSPRGSRLTVNRYDMK